MKSWFKGNEILKNKRRDFHSYEEACRPSGPAARISGSELSFEILRILHNFLLKVILKIPTYLQGYCGDEIRYYRW